MKKVGILRCQKLESICPMFDCLQAYHNGSGTFGTFRSENGGEPLQLAGVATCGGCAGNRNGEKAKKMVDNMLAHGIEVVFLSSCIIREEFFPTELEEQSLEQVEKNIRTCLFHPSDPYADHQAHEVACAFCAGHLEAACPNKLPEIIKDYLKGKAKLVNGTHLEHMDTHNLNPIALYAKS